MADRSVSCSSWPCSRLPWRGRAGARSSPRSPCRARPAAWPRPPAPSGRHTRCSPASCGIDLGHERRHGEVPDLTRRRASCATPGRVVVGGHAVGPASTASTRRPEAAGLDQGRRYHLRYCCGLRRSCSIWITNRVAGMVQRISPTSNRVKMVAFPPGAAPAGIGRAAGALWVGTTMAAVFRLDPRTYRVTRVASGRRCSLVDRGQRRTDVWVSNTKQRLRTRYRRRPAAGGRDGEGGGQPGQPGGDRRRRVGAGRHRQHGHAHRRRHRERSSRRSRPGRNPGRRRGRRATLASRCSIEAQVWRAPPGGR